MTDKELLKKLKELSKHQAGGRVDSVWAKENKEILMSQIKGSSQKEPAGDYLYYWKFFSSFSRQRIIQPVGVGLMVAFVYFVGVATVGVANASLPGDMLYPIKTAQEKVQIALTFDEEKKAELQMNFVSRRGDELQQIVRKPEATEVKKEKVIQTVKKISQDIQQVKEGLNKIDNQNTVKAVSVAKKVDEQTLKVEKDIVDAHKTLPQEVKKEVAKDVKEAISQTEETGTKAVQVIVKKFEADKTVASDSEVASRVASRIKATEETIQGVSKEVDKITASSTTAVINIDKTTTTTTVSTTLEMVKDKPQEAQVVIEQAKNLLDQKNFSSALEKVQESKEIVNEVIVKPVITDIKPDSTSTMATSTSSTK